MARKHLAKQLREEVLTYLRQGEPLPQILADWLAGILDAKDIDLFADPWAEFVPTAEQRRQLKMAIMARVLKNRPELWPEQNASNGGFLAAAADLFSATVSAVRQACDEHREMLDFFEERMGLTHLPTKSDILAYRDAGLERVAEALEETLRTDEQLAKRILNCLGPGAKTDTGEPAS
jgi:hypothetical protein